VRNSLHQQAVMLLIAPSNEVVLEVRHDPQPPGLQVFRVVYRMGKSALSDTVYCEEIHL
jgi:hypothetical protein